MSQPLKATIPVVEVHTFRAKDFIGGDVALDFVNTVTGRDKSPRDWLDSYGRLLEWARKGQSLPQNILQRLSIKAKKEPAAADKALVRAKLFREELFALLIGITGNSTPSDDALALLRKHWLAGAATLDLRLEEGRIIKAAGRRVDFDSIANAIGYRIVEYVLMFPPGRLRMCEGPNCSWFFLDKSKAGRRRWCDMAVCGNAAKSRRFHAQHSVRQTQ